jgi:hypothetical protein
LAPELRGLDLEQSLLSHELVEDPLRLQVLIEDFEVVDR